MSASTGVSDLASRLARGLAQDVPDGAVLEAVPEPGCPGIPALHLEQIHRFARANPIYRTSRRTVVSGVTVRVYEGDLNRYWLGSIQHSSCRAPFSPTWMLSAYALASAAGSMGFLEAVDVGSGDGRIAHFAGVCGMRAYGVELDGDLAGLQAGIADSTGSRACLVRADAAAFDYGALDLERPAFFIGGLAQMGGARLAGAVLDWLGSVPGLLGRSCIVLAGTHSVKYAPSPPAGWGSVIRERGLGVLASVELPTAWTAGEGRRTPYLYCGA